MKHNTSSKPHARLMHALWMISNPKEIAANLQFNVRVQKGKWRRLQALNGKDSK